MLGPYRSLQPYGQFPLYYPCPKYLSVRAIYCRSLMSAGSGIPLYDPVGFSPIDAYLRSGTSIGDVGYIDSAGAFQYLFNIFHERDHTRQGRFIPREFRPIEPPLSEWETRLSPNYFEPGTILTSQGIQVAHLSANPLCVGIVPDMLSFLAY